MCAGTKCKISIKYGIGLEDGKNVEVARCR